MYPQTGPWRMGTTSGFPLPTPQATQNPKNWYLRGGYKTPRPLRRFSIQQRAQWPHNRVTLGFATWRIQEPEKSCNCNIRKSCTCNFCLSQKNVAKQMFVKTDKPNIPFATFAKTANATFFLQLQLVCCCKPSVLIKVAESALIGRSQWDRVTVRGADTAT